MVDLGIGTKQDFASSGALGAPRVIFAEAIDSTIVRVRYDQEMKKSNPAEGDDALNPSNYTFVVTGGVPVNAVSCALHQSLPTHIDITLASEMTSGSSIKVTVSNVVSAIGALIDSSYDDYTFVGYGYKPQMVSATPIDGVLVEVLFNEAMSSSGLTTPSNYTFIPGGGADPLTAFQVDIKASNKVWVWTETPQTIGGDYTIVASNVKDLANNPIDDPPDDRADFVGVEVTTKLDDVEVLSDIRLRLHFSKPMAKDAELLDIGNYILTPQEIETAPLYFSQISPQPGTYPEYVDIVVSEMTNGKLYNAEVSTDITDRWGNHISAFFKDKDFTGQGSPPSVESVVAENSTRALVTFNEVMRDNADIRNPTKYVFDQGLQVLAVLDVVGATVTLVTSEQTPGVAYNLTVSP